MPELTAEKITDTLFGDFNRNGAVMTYTFPRPADTPHELGVIAGFDVLRLLPQAPGAGYHFVLMFRFPYWFTDVQRGVHLIHVDDIRRAVFDGKPATILISQDDDRTHQIYRLADFPEWQEQWRRWKTFEAGDPTMANSNHQRLIAYYQEILDRQPNV